MTEHNVVKTLKPELWEAILSNEVEKVRDLLQNISTSDEDLMTSLARDFEVIKFKNVPITHEIVCLVYFKLMHHRFFSTKDDQSIQDTKFTIENVLTRINIIKEHTGHLANNQCDVENLAMFSLRAQIICHHMEILKKILKTTHYFLPWEEMQFCLLMFIITLYHRSDEACTMYQLVLDRKRVVTYVELFTETLCDVGANLRSKDIKSKVRLPSRKTLIKSVVDRSPAFRDLYSDYEIVRDIYSLTKIIYYIQESLKLDQHLQLQKLAVQRALQVMGENLKNSAESPNVSPRVHRILMKSAPSGLKEVITSLRDVLSHSYSLLGRMQVEDNKNTMFLTLQSDLQFIQSAIYVALNEIKEEAIIAFLEKIGLASNLEEVKYLLSYFLLGNVKNHRSPEYDVPMRMVSNIETMCQKIHENIPDQTSFESTLFGKVFELLALERDKIGNSEYRLQSLLTYLSHIIDNVNYLNDLTQIKKTFESVYKALNFFKGEPCNYYRQMRHLLYNIYASLRSRNSASELQIQDLDRVMDILHVNVVSMTTAEEFKMNIDADHIYEADTERHVDKMIKAISSLTMSKQMQKKIMDGWEKKKLVSKVKSQCDVVIREMTQSLCYAKSEACAAEWETLIKQLGTKKETEEELLSLHRNKNIEGCKRLLNLIDDSYATLFNNFKDYALFMDKNKQNALNRFLLSLKLNKNEVEHIMTMFGEHLEKKIKIIYKDRLSVLKTVLDKEQIALTFIKDEALQLAVETLVLDLLEILEKLSFCGDNRFCIDEFAPSITGKALRNFLAHGNLFLDVLPSNTAMSVICTALKLVECGESLLNMKHVLIGNTTVPDDEFIKQRHQELLHHVDLQTTMLSYVAKDDFDNVMKSIRQGASVFGPCTYGHNILQHAARANSLECFKFGLDELRKVKDIDHGGQLTASLYLAARNGSEKIIYFYIENHLDLTCSADGTSLVHILAECGHTEILKTLISEHSFDVRVYDGHKASPLHLAAAENHLDIVQLLLSHGCSVTDKCACAKSPLHMAAKNGNTAIVDLLLNHAAMPENFINEGKCLPLHLAAEKGHPDVVSLLLRHGADPLLPNSKGMTALQISNANGHLSVVKILFGVTLRNDPADSGLDAYTIEELKTQILVSVSIKGDPAILRFLIDEGMSVEGVHTANGSNLVQVAIQAGHRDVVNMLIAAGAEPNWRNYRAQTPLHFACEHGRKDIVTDLLAAGAQVNVVTRQGLTPLSLACLIGCTDVVVTLLDNGADINLTTFDCITPLHAAVWSENMQTITHLLDSGARVNAQTIKGVAPLHLAARKSTKDITRALLKHGALVDVEDEDRLTSLHIACRDGHAAVAKTLLDAGARIDARTVRHQQERDPRQLYESTLGPDSWCQSGACVSASGLTPLHLAAFRGRLDVVSMLMDRGAAIDAPADNGMTPLGFACQEGHVKVAGLLRRSGAAFDAPLMEQQLLCSLRSKNDKAVFTLLKLGVSPNAGNSRGFTALHHAASARNVDAVQMLVARGAVANRPSADGHTPLHVAVYPRNEEVVRVLLRNGADPNATCCHGETPVDVAVKVNVPELVDILREAGGKVNQNQGGASDDTEQSSTHDNCDTQRSTNDNCDTKQSTNDNCNMKQSTNANCDTDQSTINNCDAKQSTNDNSNKKQSTNDNCDKERSTNDNCDTTQLINDNCDTKQLTDGKCDSKRSLNDNCDTKQSTNDNGDMKQTINDNCDMEQSTDDNCGTEQATNGNYDTKQSTNADCSMKQSTHNNCYMEHSTINNCDRKQSTNDNSNTNDNCGKEQSINVNCDTAQLMNANCDTKQLTNGNCDSKQSINEKCDTEQSINDNCDMKQSTNDKCDTEQWAEDPIPATVSHGDITSDKKATERLNTYQCCKHSTFTSVTCINCGSVFHRSCAADNDTLLFLDGARVVCCSGDDDEKVKSLYARIDALISERNLWRKRFQDCQSNTETLMWNNKMLMNNLEKNINVIVDKGLVEDTVIEKCCETDSMSAKSSDT